MTESKYIATPSRTQQILSEYGLTFKKSLGQNFLIDVNILHNIIHHAGIDKASGVIEIGPGIGALTEQLALHADKVVAYEIDQRFLPVLNNALAEHDNAVIVHQDVLQADIGTDIKTYFQSNQPLHVVANLPYYITTPILMKLLMDNLPVTNLTVMIQKEVAQRMAASPNSKRYGSLSIAVQYYTEAQVVMSVPKTAFMPQPNVDSSILKLVKRSAPPVNVLDETFFFTLVRACFAQRRKTLRNNLIAFFKQKYDKETVVELIQQADIDGTRRGETLSIAEFANIANVFKHNEEK